MVVGVVVLGMGIFAVVVMLQAWQEYKKAKEKEERDWHSGGRDE